MPPRCSWPTAEELQLGLELGQALQRSAAFQLWDTRSGKLEKELEWLLQGTA